MKAKRPGRNQKGQEGKKPDREPERGAFRTCLISRTVHPRAHLLRFGVDSLGWLAEDLAGSRPGRGVYIQPTRCHVAGLVQRRGLLRRLGSQLLLPEAGELQDRLSLALKRRMLDGIGLARRSRSLLLDVWEM
ncbi:MAG: DUF448 domain-containing protein, partial [Magnetococcales bacterium]|nr:DUF448 domain-containing protein [Magnetococcales bacterium]